MRRALTDRLVEWKDARRRQPLLLRGARQVGKTWAVTDFATRHMPGRLHVVDFERDVEARRLFEGDLDIDRILGALEVTLGRTVEAGRDLLFLDEIQACPRALVALRCFFEQLPELHVVAAGSLIEFALSSVSFPVGRVEMLNLHPLSLREFLWAVGNDPAADAVSAAPRDLGPALHETLLGILRDYLFVGGMPAAVAAFAETGRISEARIVHNALLDAYRADFGKYSPRVDPACLDEVLTSVGRSVGRQITYTSLAEGYTHPTIRTAFDALRRARIVHKISAARLVGAPLGAAVSARTRKAILVDLGLMHALTDMSVDAALLRHDLLDVYNGALAEQFVGQELLAATDRDLFYWSRSAKGSTAEVDYLVTPGGSVRAVEVKSGPAGKLKSMHLLLAEHPEVAPGSVLSTARYAELPEQGLVFAPLYFAAALARGVPAAG
jgi:predicted AAA+ superfamily ATPase